MNIKKSNVANVCLGATLLGAGMLAWHRANQQITLDFFQYRNPNLSTSFEGFRILHVSDLHNTSFGRHQRHLLAQVKKACPDIIVISGDLLDKRRSTKENLIRALTFVREASKLAPIYYVPGNHEATSELYPYLKEQLVALQVQVLEHHKVRILRNHEELCLLGIKDPKFYRNHEEEYLKDLTSLVKGCDAPFKLLLSHRPELFSVYADLGVSLCFCGHAHGGQIRLPMLGGLYAPNQGFLPEYTNGSYRKKDTTMFVSRGLGNSRAPLRIGNHPHLLCITLYKED